MTVQTLSGARIWLGPQATSATDTAAEYIALTPYILIGEVEDMGEAGDEAGQVKFANVGAARIRTLKGARDAGVLTLICGHDPLDVGQIALIAAEQTNFEYAIKVELADAPTADYTKSIMFWRGLIMSARLRMGTNDNVVRRVFAIGINSDIVDVPSEEISP